MACAAAGCAYQPRIPFAAAQGVDNVIYGATAAPVVTPPPSAPTAPGYRGFFGSGPAYATAPTAIPAADPCRHDGAATDACAYSSTHAGTDAPANAGSHDRLPSVRYSR